MELRSLLTPILLLITFGIISYQKQADTACQTPNRPHITVFVHGVVAVERHLYPKQIVRFIRDDIYDTLYETNVRAIRDDEFLYQNQAIAKPGLHPIKSQDVAPGNTTGALAFLFDTMSLEAGNLSENHYYTFGWSGLHSNKEYEVAGNDLFEQLAQEINTYKSLGHNPIVTVIGYSHGGNVALNLGAAHQKHPNCELHINNLVLLGTPLHKQTYQHIANDIFGIVYNLFSGSDKVQRIDLLTPSMFACSKKIYGDETFALPDKLRQVQLKITRCAQGVKDNPDRFAHSCNYKKPSIINGRSKLLVNESPGHAEMWFFGWALRDYRKNWVISPLPMVCLLPFIIKHIESVAGTSNPNNHFVFDLRPQHGSAIITTDTGNTIDFHGVLPTIQPETLTKIKQKIWQYQPLDYTQNAVDYHMEVADAHAWHMRYERT